MGSLSWLSVFRIVNQCTQNQSSVWQGEGASLLQSLPPEIWSLILSLLDVYTLLISLGSSCRAFQELAYKELHSPARRSSLFIAQRVSPSWLRFRSISKSLLLARHLLQEPDSFLGQLLTQSLLCRCGEQPSNTTLDLLLSRVPRADQEELWRLLCPCLPRNPISWPMLITVALRELHTTRLPYTAHGSMEMRLAFSLVHIQDMLNRLGVHFTLHSNWYWLSRLAEAKIQKEEAKKCRKRSRSSLSDEDRKRRCQALNPEKIAAVRPLHISNIVAVESVGVGIDTNAVQLAYAGSGRVSYDPAVCPGLILRDMPGTSMAFANGSLIYTGYDSMEKIQEAATNTRDMLRPYFRERSFSSPTE